VCTQSCASVLLCRGISVRRGRARDGDGPHMHARARHAPADTPARFRTAKLPSTTPNTAVMRSRRRRSRQSLPNTRCCWRPKWAPRSLHPREQTNKDSLTRMQKAHAHTHAVPCSSCLRERERERERERGLLTIKKRLKGGKYNALSGHTASGRSGSSI
jgi:hypothetical protein